MSDTMARQGGRVQLEQSDMRLALNMAKMAKGGFSCAAVEETQYRIKKPRAEVRAEMQRGVEFPGHNQVKAAIVGHPVMLCQHQMDGCLPCQNGSSKHLETDWRRKGTGAPRPNRRRPLTPRPSPEPTPEPTSEPMPSLPRTPPAPPGSNAGAQHSQIINVPAGYTYLHTACPCAESFTLDASDQDNQNDNDSAPDMVTDEGTATG